MKTNFSFVLFILLIIVLQLSVGLTAAYFLSNKSIEGSITLGELDFTVNCEFEKNMQAVPNAEVLCDLVLVNKKESGEYNNLIDFYFRMKLEAQSNGVEVFVEPILNNNNWYFDGEFYYYKEIVQKNSSVDICNNVLIDKNTGNDVQGGGMEIDVLFEAIQYNAVEDIWGKNIFENITNF